MFRNEIFATIEFAGYIHVVIIGETMIFIGISQLIMNGARILSLPCITFCKPIMKM